MKEGPNFFPFKHLMLDITLWNLNMSRHMILKDWVAHQMRKELMVSKGANACRNAIR